MASNGNGKPPPADPMDLSALTPEQTEALKELKQRFEKNSEQYVHDEHYLIHWLRARRFDVSKAEAMLRYHLRYRKAWNMDSQAYRNLSVNPILERYYTRGQIGHDKQGRPVVYFPFGGIDAKGILSSVRYSEAIHTIGYWMEQRRWACEEATKKEGKYIGQIFYIVDLKGVGVKHLWKPGIDAFKQISEAVQVHTPEIIYKLYVLNAPNIFSTIYNLIKPIVDENTQRKIHVYGDNFKEALLEEIDADQLPAYYGGTLVGPDGDPKCPHAIKFGGEVPQELYFKDTVSPPDSELTNVTISRGKQLLIPVIVHKPMTELKWYFKNEATNDVGFGIYRKVEDRETDLEKMDMVVPYGRMITFLVPEWGGITLKEPGTYLVLFDNSYSWIQSKTIKYRFDMKELA